MTIKRRLDGERDAHHYLLIDLLFLYEYAAALFNYYLAYN